MNETDTGARRFRLRGGVFASPELWKHDVLGDGSVLTSTWACAFSSGNAGPGEPTTVRGRVSNQRVVSALEYGAMCDRRHTDDLARLQAGRPFNMDGESWIVVRAGTQARRSGVCRPKWCGFPHRGRDTALLELRTAHSRIIGHPLYRGFWYVLVARPEVCEFDLFGVNRLRETDSTFQERSALDFSGEFADEGDSDRDDS